jgi:hypothetical protein
MRWMRVCRNRSASFLPSSSPSRWCALPGPGGAAHCHSTLSLHTAVDCHGLPPLRDLHGNLAGIAVMFCRNDRCRPGLALPSARVISSGSIAAW